MGYKPGQDRPRGTFEKPPIGLKCPAVLAAYYPAGVHKGEYKGTPTERNMMVLVWELDKNDSKGRQFRMFEVQSNSFYGQARLKARVESIIRRPLTDTEVDGEFDMDNALGCTGMLYVGGDAAKGSTWIEKVDELQDENVRVAVRHDYTVLPRYVSKVLQGAIEGTVPGQYGFVNSEGKVIYTDIPEALEAKDEDKGGNGESAGAAQDKNEEEDLF